MRGLLGFSVFLGSLLFVIAAFHQNTTQIANYQIQKQQVLAAQTNIPSNPYITVVNKLRREAGIPTLLPSNANQAIADIRAQEIVDTLNYSHNRPAGGSFSDLYQNLPAQSCENLQLQGTSSALDAMRAWMQSDSHRACLLHPESRFAGMTMRKIIDNTDLPTYIFTYVGSSN